MSEFLDTLKIRLADAQRRMQEVTARLQAAQVEHQLVNQEVFGWQKAVEAETLREQNTATIPTSERTQAPDKTIVAFASTVANTAESNKTEAIRELLRQHPAGMTPAQVWSAMRDQVAHRPYIYSVLKRLKDRKQVVERRGKYFVQQSVSKSEEGQSVLQ